EVRSEIVDEFEYDDAVPELGQITFHLVPVLAPVLGHDDKHLFAGEPDAFGELAPSQGFGYFVFAQLSESVHCTRSAAYDMSSGQYIRVRRSYQRPARLRGLPVFSVQEPKATQSP